MVMVIFLFLCQWGITFGGKLAGMKMQIVSDYFMLLLCIVCDLTFARTVSPHKHSSEHSLRPERGNLSAPQSSSHTGARFFTDQRQDVG